MDYKTAKTVKPGDSLLIKPRRYQPTTVLEISEDTSAHAVFFRCTDGLFYHDALIRPLPFDELAQIHLNSPKTEVWINHNNDTGVWRYSIEVVGSGGFWLDSFESEEEALAYISQHHLRMRQKN